MTNETFVPRVGDEVFLCYGDFGILWGTVKELTYSKPNTTDYNTYLIAVYIDECKGRDRTLEFNVPIGLVWETFEQACAAFREIHESNVYGNQRARLK